MSDQDTLEELISTADPKIIKMTMLNIMRAFQEGHQGMPEMNQETMAQAVKSGEDITNIVTLAVMITFVRNLKTNIPDWTNYMDPELREETVACDCPRCIANTKIQSYVTKTNH
jgi:hypothetical protein